MTNDSLKILLAFSAGGIAGCAVAIAYTYLNAASAGSKFISEVSPPPSSSSQNTSSSSTSSSSSTLPQYVPPPGIRQGVMGLIGSTPMVRIASLSDSTGCEIYAKVEYLNPGGSSKDRVAAQIILDATSYYGSSSRRRNGLPDDDDDDESKRSSTAAPPTTTSPPPLSRLQRGHSTLVEGTSGSTGISLAVLAAAKGYKCHVVMPDDVAVEKQELLQLFGASVQRVKPASIVHEDNYVNVARRVAERLVAEAEARVGKELNTSYDGITIRSAIPTSTPPPPVVLPTPRLPSSSSSLSSEEEDESVVPGTARQQRSGSNSSIDRGITHFPDDEAARLHGNAIARAAVVAEVVNEETHPQFHGASTSPTTTTSTTLISSSSSSPTTAGLFCDQFECEANFRAHWFGTGPEIWSQTQGNIAAFVMGAGTGGTLAGVGAYLKYASKQKKNASIPKIFLVDPPGSSLYNRVVHGVAFATQQAERRMRRHRYDTIIEGVGLDRVTANFAKGLPHIDGAFTCTDAEAVAMSRFLLRADGFFVGSSSAMNCVGAVKVARALLQKAQQEQGQQQKQQQENDTTTSGAVSLSSASSSPQPPLTPPVIVTLLCDSGARHLSRFWNTATMETLGLSGAVTEGEQAGKLYAKDCSPSPLTFVK